MISQTSHDTIHRQLHGEQINANEGLITTLSIYLIAKIICGYASELHFIGQILQESLICKTEICLTVLLPTISGPLQRDLQHANASTHHSYCSTCS